MPTATPKNKPATRSRKPRAASSSKQKSSRRSTSSKTSEVLYATPAAKAFHHANKEGALTVIHLKEMLGWREEGEEEKFEKEYLFKDRYGKPIRCDRIQKQRFFDRSLAERWMREILAVDSEGQRHWQWNGEAMSIGKFGTLLEGQHRAVGAVWAYQEWEKEPDSYPHFGKEGPTIDATVSIGVEEDLRVINTINTGKPRSLADAIFASNLFKLDQSKVADRKLANKLAAVASDCVRRLWSRTGAGLDAASPFVAHATFLDFIERHKSLLKSVQHIHEEEDGASKKISSHIPLGNAAALCYLFSVSKTEREQGGKGYSEVDSPSERQLVFETRDLAEEFFVLLAAKDPRLDGLRTALGRLHEHDDQSMGEEYEPPYVSIQEKFGLVVNAWNLFVEGQAVSCQSCRGTGLKGKSRCPKCDGWGGPIALQFGVDEHGARVLEETPVCGGIDLGEFVPN